MEDDQDDNNLKYPVDQWNLRTMNGKSLEKELKDRLLEQNESYEELDKSDIYEDDYKQHFDDKRETRSRLFDPISPIRNKGSLMDTMSNSSDDTNDNEGNSDRIKGTSSHKNKSSSPIRNKASRGAVQTKSSDVFDNKERYSLQTKLSMTSSFDQAQKRISLHRNHSSVARLPKNPAVMQNYKAELSPRAENGSHIQLAVNKLLAAVSSEDDDNVATLPRRDEDNVGISRLVQNILEVEPTVDNDKSARNSQDIRPNFKLEHQNDITAKRVQRIQLRAAGKTEIEINEILGTRESQEGSEIPSLISSLTDDRDSKRTRNTRTLKKKKKTAYADESNPSLFEELISDFKGMFPLESDVKNMFSPVFSFLESINMPSFPVSNDNQRNETTSKPSNTKIRSTISEAIEDGDFSSLPIQKLSLIPPDDNVTSRSMFLAEEET